MSNGKFIVCDPWADTVVAGQAASVDRCDDCGGNILLVGKRDPGVTYICNPCLPQRLASNEPDEVEVTVGDDQPAPEAKLEGDALWDAMADCKEASEGNCSCRWCQHVNPLAADIAQAIKAHPEADKLTRVFVLIRMLGEAAVAANSMLGLHHRDASFTAGAVARELHRVADREHMAAVATMKPIIEEAMREAGIDVEEILRSKLPKERAH